MSDAADSPSEEHEKALALAADCAKLWPKMLAKGLQEEPADDAPKEGQLHRERCHAAVMDWLALDVLNSAA